MPLVGNNVIYSTTVSDSVQYPQASFDKTDQETTLGAGVQSSSMEGDKGASAES